LRWIARWYFSFEKEFVPPPWILKEWDLEVDHELVVQVEYEGPQECKFHCCIKEPLAMIFTFPWEEHTQQARWDWEPLFSFPKLHNISFHHVLWKVFNCWLTKDLHLSYVIDVLFYFIFTTTFPKNIYFCTMKNSEHNRDNSLSTPPPSNYCKFGSNNKFD
jgi:hypothetical protein